MINIQKSKLRLDLLAFFFDHPGTELYVRELARLIKADPTNLSRELVKLEKLGILISSPRGNQKFYKLNSEYFLYRELKSIIAKTAGIEKKLFNIVNGAKGIRLSFIYGSYATEKETEESDIDLMIIGDVKEEEIISKINILEKKVGRDINYRILSVVDLERLLREKNSFILNIIRNKKIFLKGNEEYIKRLTGKGISKKRKRNKI